MLYAAIIGTGNISAAHIRGYLTFPEEVKIVALCDIYPEKAEQKKRDFGLTDAVVTPDYRELTKLAHIDLVSVCTPPYTHAEIAADMLRAGCHVLLEKPMAASLEECDRVLAAQRESGMLLGQVAQNRFTTPYMQLKQTLDSGLIGRVTAAQVDSLWWRGHSYYDLWWRGTWEKEGGGCTLNHAVHHIDLLLWLLGMPERVTAVLSNAAHDNSEVEDISVAVCEYAGGALATVTSSVIHHGEAQQVVLQGEHARVSAPWGVYASTAMPNGFPVENKELEAKLEALHGSLPVLEYTGHTAQIQDFLRAVAQGGRPFITGEDGRRTLELISAIYQAGFARRTVTLPLTPADPFYTVAGIQNNVRHFYTKTASVLDQSGQITVGGDMGGTKA